MKRKVHGIALINTILALMGVIFIMAVAAFKIPEFLNNSKEAKAAQLTSTVASLVSQYKMEIGKYPDSLDELTKENGQYGPWLKVVPKDPFDGGNELQYMKDASNYAVYSVGKNGSSDSSASSIGGDDIGFTGK